MNVNIVNVFKNFVEPASKKIYTNELVHWESSTGELISNHPERQSKLLSDDSELVQTLRKEDIFCGNTHDLTDEVLKRELIEWDIKSLSAIPIFTLNHFWGFVCF